MQRRKVVSMLKVKPRLVLQRDRLATANSSLQEESSPFSIIRIAENKQNPKMIRLKEARSLDKLHRAASTKLTHFHVRSSTPLAKGPPEDRACGKSLRDCTPATQPPIQQSRMDIELFLVEMVRHLMASPQVFHFSGDFTLSASLLSRIARTIAEEIGYNSPQLENIIHKLQELVNGPAKQDPQEPPVKDAPETALRVPSLALCPLPDLAFTHYPPSIETHSEKSCVAGEVDEAGGEGQAFVFGHLRELDEYILHQPNKILHEAVRRHKYLEEELFAYADMVSISRVGSSTYTPEANICFLEGLLDNEMRELNRELVQGDSPLEAKGRLLRNYVLRVREGYAGVVQELMRVIDRKTELARTFVDKVLKWEENYLARKEYLGNLKRDYCRELHTFTTALAALKHYPQDSSVPLSAIEDSVAAIHHIFLLGNSFY